MITLATQIESDSESAEVVTVRGSLAISSISAVQPLTQNRQVKYSSSKKDLAEKTGVLDLKQNQKSRLSGSMPVARSARLAKATAARKLNSERSKKLRTLPWHSDEFSQLLRSDYMDSLILVVSYGQIRKGAEKSDQFSAEEIQRIEAVLKVWEARLGHWIGEQIRCGKSGWAVIKSLPQRIATVRMNYILKRLSDLGLRASGEMRMSARDTLRHLPFEVIRSNACYINSAFCGRIQADDTTIRKALNKLGVYRQRGRPRKLRRD